MSRAENSEPCSTSVFKEPECLADAIAMSWPESIADDVERDVILREMEEVEGQPSAEPPFGEEEDDIQSLFWPYEVIIAPFEVAPQLLQQPALVLRISAANQPLDVK